MYLTLPVTGAMLAFVFYIVIRGGLFAPRADYGSTSPFGFMALASLVGLFSHQASLKLREVAETVFTRQPDGADAEPEKPAVRSMSAQGPGSGRAVPVLTSTDPAVVTLGAPTRLRVLGDQFTEDSGVEVDGVQRDTQFIASTELTVELEDSDVAAAGKLSITVVTPPPGGGTSAPFEVEVK